MVEMVSRRLQQRLLPPGGNQLCGAMREAILTLCRDNLAYGGQVEVDGIICITGPHDGQQLVVKVHELLDNDRLLAEKARLDIRDGNSDMGPEKNHRTSPRPPEANNREQHGTPPGGTNSGSPSATTTVTKQATTSSSAITSQTPAEDGASSEHMDEQEQNNYEQEDRRSTTAREPEEDRNENEEENEDGGLNTSDHYGSEGLDSRRAGEVEALDLRLDSPAARIIKQEPMEYEESTSHRYHPYGSSSSSGSIYRPSSSQDIAQIDGGGMGRNMTSLDDRFPAAECGSRRARSSSPHTPHTPLLVPFLGPSHHHNPHHHPADMPADMAIFPAPHGGASPFMDSRLRHLLAKMPYGKPHPGLPFLNRRPMFPTMSMLHSGAPECKACGFTFAQVELLKEHNEAVHAVFTCNVCYRTFTSRSNLDRHSRLHTGHKPYICVKCGKSFSRKDHLTNHSAKHAFKCGKCLKRFVERNALQGHYDQDHQVPLTNICEHCNKGFSDPAVFAEHLKSHPEYLGGAKIHPKHKPFACTECNYVCADKLQLLKHSQLHSENGKNLVYSCLACGESFNDPLLYSQHFEEHEEETDIFECCICRKMCHTWRELKQHEQSHLHPLSRGPTLACPVCYIIFDNPDVLAEHVQSHDPSVVDLDGFPCNVCNEVFSSLEEQQRHEQEEKHYVKKAFISPHHPLASSPLPVSLSLPQSDGQTSPRPLSADRALLSSVYDSDSNDSEEELDVIAVDEPPSIAPSTSNAVARDARETPEEDAVKKEDATNSHFVVTDNPAPVIEVSASEADACVSPVQAPLAVTCRSHSSSSSSSLSSPYPAPMSLAPTNQPPAPPSAAVFPERSPLHPSMAISPPPLPLHHPGPLASFVAAHSPQPSPDPMSSAGAWLPPQFHNHNSTPYGFSSHLAEYACPVCDAKLLSFHDYETHCFSDHFRYPCMYCTKTFAQKANRDRHVCIHTGEKPYSCPECDQKFARGDKLKIHRAKWHNIQFPSTYNRPKEAAGSGDWPSSRRKDGSDDVTPGSQKDLNSGRGWSDSESQEPGLGDSQDQSSSYEGIKAEGHAQASSLGPE